MYLYVLYEEAGMFDTSGNGTSETALQCNFELIPLQVDTLVSYEAGSPKALIVISLIVSGSVASTLRWFIRLATESQDPLTTSWSPVIAPL